ncbi:MAG: hypothetical protein ACRYGK_15490 [Janthinobacterium lividum]
MAITIQQLFAPLSLGTAASVIYTASAVLKNGRVRLTNTSNAAISVSLYAAAAAAASGAGNACLSAKSIAGSDYLDIDVPTLASGDTLRGMASAAGITVHQLDGVLYSA